MLLMLIITTVAVPAQAEATEDMVQEQVRQLELQEIEAFWQELQREVGEYLPDITWKDFLAWISSGQGQGISLSEIFNGLWRYLWRELYVNLNLLGKLLFLAVIAALLKNLERAFASDSIAALSQAVVYLALITIAMQSFAVAIALGRETVSKMVELILALIPLLLALLASLGSFASSVVFRPLIIFAINFFATLTKDVVFPLIFLTTILSVVNYFSPRVTVSKLADLLKNAAVWIMGLSMTIFIGMLSINGLASMVGDAVALRTAKYVSSAFLPVIGGMISDAMETVAGATLILKNTVHIAGIVVLFYLVAFPLIKILALVSIYKLASALIQPLGETNLCDSLNTLGNCLALVFAAVAVVGIIFYVAITIIAGAANASFMLR